MKPTQKKKTVLDLYAEVKRLEGSPYVQLAKAEELARQDLQRRLAELRELDKRGRFLYAGGLTIEDLGWEDMQ